MNEVADIHTLDIVINPIREEIKKPQRYNFEARTTGIFCFSKFVMVAIEVFSISKVIAEPLCVSIYIEKVVEISFDLTFDVAEMRAYKANKFMDELVGTCKCGSQLKFIPVAI